MEINDYKVDDIVKVLKDEYKGIKFRIINVDSVNDIYKLVGKSKTEVLITLEESEGQIQLIRKGKRNKLPEFD